MALTEGSVEYTRTVWRGMKKRCFDTQDDRWKDYGGRGITMDPMWMDFNRFVEDMGLRPPGKQIDRIDNNGNYCKSNCKWSTRMEQHSNTRRSRHLLLNGRTQTVSQWARELGVHRSSILARLRRGMDAVEALTRPFIRMELGPHDIQCPWCKRRWRTRIRNPKYCGNCKRMLATGETYMKMWHRRRKERDANHIH